MHCWQVKDPSKAAHASEEDIKDLLQFRGQELKKDTLEEAKPDQKRYDQVSHLLYNGYQACLVLIAAVSLNNNNLHSICTR